jgi:hypothetical protein
MSVNYSNVGNPISQALGGLTQYLMLENQRLDEEQKEQKINLASEKIAEGYQSLPPDATIADIQKLQFQLIEDAAALGGLQENMPLLSSLYSSTLASREVEKVERRDSALYKYLAANYDLKGLSPDMGGEITMGVVDFKRRGQRDVSYMDAQGKTVLNIWNDDLTLNKSIPTSDFGVNEQFEMDKKKMDYAYRQDLAKLKYAHTLSNPNLSASGPQVAGYDLYTNNQGIAGETLYKHHKNGGTYFLNKKTGALEPYWGQIQKVSGKTGTDQVQDVLQTLQTTTSTFQPERLGLVQTLSKIDGGKDFLEALVGGALPVDKDMLLDNGAVTAVDQALRQPNAMGRLKSIYGDMNEEKAAKVGAVMQYYQQNLSNQMNIENVVKSTMPNSPYDGPGLLTSEEYERSSEGLFQIFSGKVPDQVSAPIRSYISKIAGVDVRNVNESVFRTLGRQQQDLIMQKLLPIIKYNQ